MSKKLYVGNLPYSVRNQELTDLFSPYGEVAEANVITDRDSGRSKGFGFIEMVDDAAASKAIEEMDGKEIEGRALRVNVAQPKAPRSNDRDRGDRGGRGGRRFG